MPAHKKMRSASATVIPVELDESEYDCIKAKMPVIDYDNMTVEEIQVAKRERNRLAAEKYRRKGRDLVEKLQVFLSTRL